MIVEQTLDDLVQGGDRNDNRESLDAMLVALINAGGSDLHLTVGAPPTIRVHGELRYLPDYERMSQIDVAMLARAATSDDQWTRFRDSSELDFAYSIQHVSRYRVNLYQQRGSVGAAFRAISDRIRPLDELGVPESVGRFASLHRGLVLVTGLPVPVRRPRSRRCWIWPTGPGRRTS